MTYPERLKQLEIIYSKSPFVHTYWKDLQHDINLDNFRYRYIGYGLDLNYYRTTFDYVKSIDKYNLLSVLSEDNDFSPNMFVLDGINLSRDLLDSVLELTFMRDIVGPTFEQAKILDVGAGYGRLAHRAATAFPKTFTYCTDGIALSTYLSELYIAHRNIGDRAKVVPFNELETIGNVDIACNIHSWSECTIDTVEFWLDFVQKSNAKYLFFVPHRGDTDNAICCDGGHNFYPSILRRGFSLIKKTPKYPAGVDGIEPANYYMFGR